MSAVLTPRRRRYTALERETMTPEQVLDLLIAEQEADDTHRAHVPAAQVSLDAPVTDRTGGYDEGTVGSELLGYDPWGLVDAAIDLNIDPSALAYSGDLVSGIRLPGLVDVRHGTLTGYRKQGCRCPKCRKANSEHVAAYRARKAAAREALSA